MERASNSPGKVIEITGGNITCALGDDTFTVFKNVKEGCCGLTRHKASEIGVNEDYIASTVPTDMLNQDADHDYTHLELMAMHSIRHALKQNDVKVDGKRTLFIMSSTKGNIDLLGNNEYYDSDRCYLPQTARIIATAVGCVTKPLVVSNACISGLSAIITASRLLESDLYDEAIVIGVDTVSRFTVSGFQSFKALSPERCKPFDVNRQGLNLGEAAATITLKKVDTPRDDRWYVHAGTIHNDANHISGPSRVGEGSFRCLHSVSRNVNPDTLAFINAHGTATLYNDEMESIAITRAGLQDIPTNAYKGYIGHTLGAAGILESLLSMESLDNSVIIPTAGYTALGVSNKLNVATEILPTDKISFIKLMSGFGGCNAAIRFGKGGDR